MVAAVRPPSSEPAKSPLTTTQHHWLDAAFTSVIADFNIWMVKVDQESRPTIEGVDDSFSKNSADQIIYLRCCFPVAQTLPFQVRGSCDYMGECRLLILTGYKQESITLTS